MNTSAEKHLAKAAGYVAKGEGFYRKAAAEMRAAKDQGATWSEIGSRLGRSDRWAQQIVAWSENPDEAKAPSPFVEPRRESTDVRGTKRVLAEAPMEQVEQIIAELPKARKQALAAVAGNQYMQARQDYAEAERNVTPAQRQERVAASEAMTSKIVAWSDAMRLTSSLELAAELLRELNASGEATVELTEAIGALLDPIQDEYRVLRAMVGLSIDLDGVEA